MAFDWKNRRVLVTGSNGFIGSHLTERLVKEGACVRAFVHYNSLNNWGWLESLPPDILAQIKILPGDVRDYNSIDEAAKDQEIVFHLASLVAIPYSYHAPDSYVQTNVQGTLNVLNACRKANISRLIHTSTSEVYGTARYVPIDENHPLQGQSPYSATKIGADMLALSYFRSFNLPVIIIRPFNTYGPRQSARAVIPTIITQLYSGFTELKLGALSPTRDFSFIEDTVTGFLKVAECDQGLGHVINIGSGKEISIGGLAELLMKITRKKASISCEKERLRPKESEVERLCCDNTRAQEWANWKQKYTLEQGLEITSNWIHKNLRNFKAQLFNI